MTLDSCFGSFKGAQGPASETSELQHKRSVLHREAVAEREGTEAAGLSVNQSSCVLLGCFLHGLGCAAQFYKQY